MLTLVNSAIYMIKARPLIKISGFFSLLLLLASCSHEKLLVDPQFIYALPPSLGVDSADVRHGDSPLRVGDSFLFNNPDQKWTVTRIAAGKVSWKSSTGDYLQTTLSTLLPPIRWGGSGSDLASGWSKLSYLQGMPYTLTAGHEFSFVEERHSIRPPDVTEAIWQCVIGGTNLILVPAGKVEATEMICNRNGRERIMLNYAQSLGHYVRQVIATDNGPVVRELVAYAREKQDL